MNPIYPFSCLRHGTKNINEVRQPKVASRAIWCLYEHHHQLGEIREDQALSRLLKSGSL